MLAQVIDLRGIQRIDRPPVQEQVKPGRFLELFDGIARRFQGLASHDRPVIGQQHRRMSW